MCFLCQLRRDETFQDAVGVVEGMTPLLCAVFAEDVDLVRLLAQSLAGTCPEVWSCADASLECGGHKFVDSHG